MRQLVLLSLCLCLWAKQDLPPLEAKLYAYIQQSQIKDHPISRYIGTWPSYPKYSGVRKEIPESNSFMTLQTLILLEEVNQDYILPDIDKVYALANQQLDTYLTDAQATHEPKGTIAFWPLLQDDDGQWIRSFDIQWYNRSMRILNVGNDFDTSSQAFAWFYLSHQNSRFQEGFTQSVSLYTDENRSLEHPANQVWKQKDSGAFLTWAEEEAPLKNPNRIMDLVNDVDCVVNLNILTALSLYENTISELPPLTLQAKENSCELINNIIINEQEDNCATWYTRASHFYLAYAKAYKADTFCLEGEHKQIIKRAKKRVKYLLSHPQIKRYTEIAEYIIILKSLVAQKERSLLLKDLLLSLEIALKQGITQKQAYAYLPSKHSLFGGQAFGIFHFNWYGRANATALALRALTMP